jgi:hypothetical protein
VDPSGLPCGLASALDAEALLLDTLLRFVVWGRASADVAGLRHGGIVAECDGELLLGASSAGEHREGGVKGTVG